MVRLNWRDSRAKNLRKTRRFWLIAVQITRIKSPNALRTAHATTFVCYPWLITQKKSAGRIYLPALFSLRLESFPALLRLEVSLNVHTSNRGHPNHVTFAGSLRCLPVLDELVASRVIT